LVKFELIDYEEGYKNSKEMIVVLRNFVYLIKFDYLFELKMFVHGASGNAVYLIEDVEKLINKFGVPCMPSKSVVLEYVEQGDVYKRKVLNIYKIPRKTVPVVKHVFKPPTMGGYYHFFSIPILPELRSAIAYLLGFG